MTITSTPIKQYIEQHHEGYWIVGTRISLDSVVYAFLNGESPETMAQNFPLLSLEQVYGAIAFYLANQKLIDLYLKEGEANFEKLQQSLREKKSTIIPEVKNCSRTEAKQGMTAVRFQADADLKQAIVTGTIRKQPDLDFQSANTAELEGKKDSEVLVIAAQDNRVLVTHDRKTMPAEFGKFIMSQTSAGVLILSQNLSISEAIEALILVWEASTAEEWVNQIMSIPF